MEKYNAALLKLELLSQGIKIDSSVHDAVGKEIKEPLRQRAGVGSGGIDLILEGEIYVGAPTMEKFSKNSPFVLKKKGANYFIEKHGRPIQKIELFPRPAFYDKTTSDGTPMRRIGTIQGDFIGISLDNRCWFWGHYKGDKLESYRGKQCKFCSIGLNLDTTEQPRKTVDQILQVCEVALKEKHCRHVALNAGTFPPPGRGHEEYAKIVQAIKENLDKYIRLSIAPPDEEQYIDILREAGADLIGYDYEVFDPELYKEICPGKYKEIDREKPRQTYDRMLRYAVKKGGPSSTYSNILAGLEPKESTVAGIEHLASMSVIPRVFVFRALTGTAMQDAPMSTPQELIYIYQKMKEIIEEKYHGDVGCPGCGRVEVGSRKHLGIIPQMPRITKEDLLVAGIDPKSIG